MKRMTLLSVLLVLGPAALAAQQVLDSRWLPWLGCWQVGDQAGAEAPLVCVRPSSDQRGVEVATVTDGEIAVARTLVADGQPHESSSEGCTGSQFAAFSADGRRAYLWSTVTCADARRRTASAIMALASPGEWLDAQSVGVDGERAPRVLRYHPAPASSWPPEFLMAPERAVAVADARLLAAADLSLADVEEAASQVDHEALAAFVLERQQEYQLSAGALAGLDDAGVPDDVIDAVVAASYPSRFVVDHDALRLALAPDQPAERYAAGYGDPYGWGWWGYGRCYGGFGYWSPYCGSLYYWSLGYGFGGYWPYWYSPYSSGGYWGRPVILVRDDGSATTRGTAVRGRGYTRGGQPIGGTGGTAQPRSQPTQRRSRDGYSPTVRSGSSSRGSASPGGYSRSGGSSSSSGSSSGSAKPKCCS